ncbi:hypothetical protein [Streptomyces sp. NPDC090093]|uniref:hypothetical protein n=1 Tax=Streptomyces sp. NPDC090093 TaxID=3365945 RepID=UPI0038194554
MTRRAHIAPAVAAVIAEQALIRFGHRITTEQATLLGASSVEALTNAGWNITATRIGGHRLSQVSPALWEHDLPILAGLARGRTYREIATETGTREGTTRHRVARLIARLGASNAPEAVAIAYRAGWMNSLAPEPRGRITLTKDAHRLLVWIAEGLDNAEIADALDAPRSTVTRHLRRLYIDLDAVRPGTPDKASRCRAVALGYQHGLLPLPTERPAAA